MSNSFFSHDKDASERLKRARIDVGGNPSLIRSATKDALAGTEDDARYRMLFGNIMRQLARECKNMKEKKVEKSIKGKQAAQVKKAIENTNNPRSSVPKVHRLGVHTRDAYAQEKRLMSGIPEDDR